MSPPSRNLRRPRTSRRARTNNVAASTVLFRGGLVIGLLGLFVYMAASLYNGIPTRDYITASASVPEVGNLIPHDPVRVSGIRVGQVKSLGVGADGRPELSLQLDPGTNLPADTKVVVRANGLLGARFVQLVPGRSTRSLQDGGQIAPAERSLTYGVPETLDTFDAATRGQLSNTLNSLGVGLAGRGEALNTTILRISEEVEPARTLFKEIMDRPGAAAALLPSALSGMKPLDDNRVDITTSFGETARALEPFVSERDAVRGVLETAPPTLDAADAGLAKGTRLLVTVRTLASSLSLTLPEAPRGLRAAAALLRESPTPLQRTDALLKEAAPTVPKLLKVTSSLRPVLAPLQLALDDLTGMSKLIGPYGCDIENLGVTFRSMTGSGGTGTGPNGPLMNFRLQAIAPAPEEALGTDPGAGALTIRDGYPEPCKYKPTAYPAVVEKPALPTGRGR